MADSKPFKAITVRSWYPSSSQYVGAKDNTGIGRNLDLLTTWPHIERAEHNLRISDGQFPERAYELLIKISFDSKRYNPNLVFILETFTELINFYKDYPYYKNVRKIHGG